MKWEEFKEKQRERMTPKDPMTMAECPKCGDYLYQQQGIVLTSYPPQHIYYCKKCGWSGTAQRGKE